MANICFSKTEVIVSQNTKPEVVLNRRGCHLENHYDVITLLLQLAAGPNLMQFGSLSV